MFLFHILFLQFCLFYIHMLSLVSNIRKCHCFNIPFVANTCILVIPIFYYKKLNKIWKKILFFEFLGPIKPSTMAFSNKTFMFFLHGKWGVSTKYWKSLNQSHEFLPCYHHVYTYDIPYKLNVMKYFRLGKELHIKHYKISLQSNWHLCYSRMDLHVKH